MGQFSSLRANFYAISFVNYLKGIKKEEVDMGLFVSVMAVIASVIGYFLWAGLKLKDNLEHDNIRKPED